MRASAHFFGKERGESAKFIYDMWEKMGLIVKDKAADWLLTERGRELGGGLSKGKFATITFDKDKLLPLMDDFYEKHMKGKLK